MLAISLISIISIIFNNFLISKYRAYSLLGVNFESYQLEDEDLVIQIRKFRIHSSIWALLIISVDLLAYKFLASLETSYLLVFSIILYLIISYILSDRARKKLLQIKEERAWNEEDHILYADTKLLTQDKKKDSLAYLLTWLIWFIWPVLIIYQSRTNIVEALDFMTFIGPFCMLTFPLLFPLVNANYNPISEDSAINIAYNNELNKINYFTYLLLFAIIQIMMVSLTLNTSLDSLGLILILSIMIMACLIIVYIQIARQGKIEKKYAKYKTINTSNNLKYYKYGFYKNENDTRLFVPKRNPAMGWTINIGNKSGKIFMFLTILMVLAIIGGLFLLSSKEIEYNLLEDRLEIDVPMYSRKIAFKDIEEIKISDEKLSAFRSNGYGGSQKAYGHFRVKGYGESMYYAYNNVDHKIFIRVKNKNEKWYILNDRTLEKTQALYQSINDKLR
ncbi:MAG: PH domain-containing protein [Tissierellia bacterium]|nr:PH domain-containing protein [Tissierellia bacterium]